MDKNFYQFKRIKVSVSSYQERGNKAITDIIGTNVIIKELNRLPITFDGYYVFDVTYLTLSLNPLKFYVIDTSELKLITEYSTDYYIRVDNIPVKIKGREQFDEIKKKKKLMIQINKTLCTESINHDYFKYYGKPIDNPLHSYISTLAESYNYKLDCREREWKDCEVKIFSETSIKIEHENFLGNTMYGRLFPTCIMDIEDENEIKDVKILYRISARKLTKFPLNGIIFVCSKRKRIQDVLVGLNNNFSVNYTQWVSLMNFLEIERQNYETFLSIL